MSASVGYATLQILPSTKGFSRALTGGIGGVGAKAGRSTGQAFGSSMSGAVGGLASKIFAPLAAAAAGIGIGAALVSSVKAAGELEQSVGAVTTVFKGQADEMLKWSQEAASSVGLTANEYNEFAAVIGTQLKNAGVPMKDLGAQTNELVTQGADLASMFGGTTADAVGALSSALKGEMDPIERYGISLNAASLEAKAAELGFAKVGGALSQEAKAAAVMALVTEQGADAMGNFAKEGDTFGGVMQRLSATWGNISTTIGQAFLPAATAAGGALLGILPTIQNLATSFRDWSVSMFETFNKAGGGAEGLAAVFQSLQASVSGWIANGGIQTLISGFATARTAFFEAIFQAAPGIIEALAAALPEIVTFIGTVLVPGILNTITTGLPLLLQAFASLIPQIVTTLQTTLPLIIQTIATLLPQIVQTITTLAPQILMAAVQAFLSLVQAVIQVLPMLLSSIVGMLPQIVSSLLSMLPQILQAGITLFTSLLTAVIKILPDLLGVLLGDLLPTVLKTVIGMLPELLSAGVELFMALAVAVVQALPEIISVLIGTVLPNLVTTLIGMIPTLISTAFQLFVALSKGILQALPQIVGVLVTQLIPSILGAFANAGSLLFQAGVNVVQGLLNGIGSLAGTVGTWFLNKLPGWIQTPFKKALGIHSPSRVFMGYGKNIVQGLVNGVSREKTAVRDTIDNLSDQITARMTKAIDKETNRVYTAYKAQYDRLRKQAKAEDDKKAKARLNALADQYKITKDAAEKIARKNLEVDRSHAKIARTILKNQIPALRAYEKQVDSLGKQLDKAKDKLKALKDAHADMRKGIASGIRGELDLMAGVGEENQPAKPTFGTVASSVKQMAARAKTFSKKLSALIRAGLPKGFVQEIAGMGSAEGIQVANAILQGSKSQIKALGKEYNSIGTYANKAGDLVADQMYNAGIKGQEGLIKGLTDDIRAVEKAAEKLAKKITNKVKKTLGIKSPSRVFRAIGGFTAEGMALGLADGAREVERAAESITPDAIFGSPSLDVRGSLSANLAGAMPKEMVLVDANGELIGRMRTEAGRVASGSITPLTLGRASW